MNFNEYAAKALLRAEGIATPSGKVADDPEGAARAAKDLGPCVIKAQVPTGKRGKAGGIKLAATADEAGTAARDILGMAIDGHVVSRLLVEEQIPIAKELYAAVISDPASKGPAVLFSTMGGMDVEEAASKDPNAMKRCQVEINEGFSIAQAQNLCASLDHAASAAAVAQALVQLYSAYRKYDGELLEINPLVLTDDGRVIALDCKFTLDDSSVPRQAQIAADAAPEKLTALEAEALSNGLKYIELDGNVGVLANGAGLTMTTMDAITHFGGSPANFLEIGGEAYTKSKVALEILLKNPNVRSLLVNFCGAFARTDVMAEGVVNAWKELKPDIPIVFTIHGTGEDEAVSLVKRELGEEPFDLMDDAVVAAVNAAKRASR